MTKEIILMIKCQYERQQTVQHYNGTFIQLFAPIET